MSQLQPRKILFLSLAKVSVHRGRQRNAITFFVHLDSDVKQSETVTAEMDPSKMHIKPLHKGKVRMSSECLTPFNLMKMSSGCTPHLWAAEMTQQKVSTCPPAPTESSMLSPPEPRIITFLDRGWGGFPDFPTGLCVITRVFTREGWRQESRGQTETGGAAGQEHGRGPQTTDAGAQEAGDTKQMCP